MGMYDYLGGEQIKIFYCPIFSNNPLEKNKYETWHSGGTLASYTKKSKLPLHTWYYKYPNDFIVYDYRSAYKDIWIIKNSKFESFKSAYNKIDDFFKPVYDYYGKELDINNPQDFVKIKEENSYYNKLYSQLEQKLLKNINQYINTNKKYNDVFEVFKDMAEYSVEQREFIENTLEENSKKTLCVFTNKWYLEDIYGEEKQLGEYLYCLNYLYNIKDEQKRFEYETDYAKEYIECKNIVENYLNNNNDLLQRYFDWLDNKKEKQKILNLLDRCDLQKKV
jgi:hypothetical protein